MFLVEELHMAEDTIRDLTKWDSIHIVATEEDEAKVAFAREELYSDLEGCVECYANVYEDEPKAIEGTKYARVNDIRYFGGLAIKSLKMLDTASVKSSDWDDANAIISAKQYVYDGISNLLSSLADAMNNYLDTIEEPDAKECNAINTPDHEHVTRYLSAQPRFCDVAQMCAHLDEEYPVMYSIDIVDMLTGEVYADRNNGLWEINC